MMFMAMLTLCTLSCRTQRVFLIRHGESEYNAACKGQQNFWDVDNIFDARLTRIGKKQVGPRSSWRHGCRPYAHPPLSQPVFVNAFANRTPYHVPVYMPP